MLQMLFSKGELNGLYSILKVLAITVIFYGLAFMLGSVLFAAELYYSIWIAVLVSVLVRLVSFSVMSSALKLDLYAGAYSDALSAFVLCLILLGMVRQQLKIAVNWLRVFLAPLLAGILMALGLPAVQPGDFEKCCQPGSDARFGGCRTARLFCVDCRFKGCDQTRTALLCSGRCADRACQYDAAAVMVTALHKITEKS